MLTPELVDRYRRLNGATVSNAIEQFGVRLRNEGFADGAIQCLTPALPPVIGHAVTARIKSSSPPPVGHLYHDRTDWWTFIATVPPPRIVVVEDADPRPGFGAFVGDVHATILRALGCAAYVTNGSVRDVSAVCGLGFQLFAARTAVSHAFAHMLDFGEAVEVAGLRVATGDLIFGDAGGVLSVPASVVEQVPRAADEMLAKEQRVIAFCKSASFSIEGLRALVRDLG